MPKTWWLPSVSRRFIQNHNFGTLELPGALTKTYRIYYNIIIILIKKKKLKILYLYYNIVPICVFSLMPLEVPKFQNTGGQVMKYIEDSWANGQLKDH